MKAPRSVLVVSLRYMGDVLLTTPLIRSIKRGHPEAAVDVLVFAGAAGMLEGNPDVRHVLTVSERPGREERAALLQTLREGGRRRYDWAVVAETGDRPHVYGWLAARRRAGLVPPALGKRWWKQLTLARAVCFAPDDARMDAYRQLAQALDVPWCPDIVAPSAGTAAESWQQRFGVDLAGLPYAVLHLAPRFRYKRWHESGWRAAMQWLHDQGLQVVLTGGTDAQERAYVDALVQATGLPVVDLCGRLRFAETADLLRGARLYLGPDTATTHLAAACGTPTLALFGPTDPRLWGPIPQAGLPQPYEKVAPIQRRGQVILLQEPSLVCVPCQQEGCERHRESYSACLDAMEAGRVVQAAGELLR
jgi:heptosyltransferase-3